MLVHLLQNPMAPTEEVPMNRHTFSALGLVALLSACGEMPSPPPAGGQVDTYACEISDEGYCVFTGSPHRLDPDATSLGRQHVVDIDGAAVRPGGRPFQDGYTLAATDEAVIDNDALAYVEVFKVMAPIRDALMYDIAHTRPEAWAELTTTLRDAGIKLESEALDSPIPPKRSYGIDDVYALARNPEGADIHHPVMKFLEESELELKCQWMEMSLVNPEGHDPCAPSP